MSAPYRDSLEPLRDRARQLQTTIEGLEADCESAGVAPSSGPEEQGAASSEQEEQVSASTSNASPEQRLTTLVQELNPKPTARQESPTELLLYFVVDETPFICRLEGAPHHGGMELHLTLSTSIPSLAHLSLRPQSTGRAVLAAIGLITDAKVLDEEFNRAFIIDADTDEARTLLTPPVREGLLAVSQANTPELDVENGSAVLRWSGAPTRDALRGGVRALVALHRGDRGQHDGGPH